MQGPQAIAQRMSDSSLLPHHMREYPACRLVHTELHNSSWFTKRTKSYLPETRRPAPHAWVPGCLSHCLVSLSKTPHPHCSRRAGCLLPWLTPPSVCECAWMGECQAVGLFDYGKNHNIDILVNIDITIIQTIIFFEFENMMYLLSISLSKKRCYWEPRNFALKKYTKWSKRKCSNLNECTDMYPAVLLSIKHLKENQKLDSVNFVIVWC